MHVGGVLVFEGRVPVATVVRRIEERLHLVPHYRMRLVSTAPFGLANPVWENDRKFAASNHVRGVRWPEPGGDAALEEITGHVMSERLDRSRPLWEVVVVDSPSRGRTALVAKMHHALADGLAAIGIATVILDPTPEPLDLPPPEGEPEERQRAWVGELMALMPQLPLRRRLDLVAPLLERVPADVAPGPRELGRMAAALGVPGPRELRKLARGLEVPGRRDMRRLAAAQLDVPRRLAGTAMDRTRALDPRTARRDIGEAVGVMRDLARVRPQAPATRLNAEIGSSRRFAMARGRLDEVKAIRRAAGATVNDVLLAAVALMLEEYLGDEAPEAAVALVPVSVRPDAEKGELGNRISTVFVDLPLRGGPLERVQAISAAMGEVKGSAQVRAGALIVGAAGLAPPAVAALTARALGAPRLFNLVVSNVPGPQQTFYLDGVALREVFPAVPLNPRNQALAIGVLSYAGGVNFGLLADHDALPDLRDAAAGIERALTTLARAAA